MKHAPIIRHVPHEGAAGYAIDRIDVTDPAFAGRDLLIMMGGPMGGYEQAQYPWIA